MDTQPVNSNEPQLKPVVIKETKSRPAVVILSVLCIIALIGVGLLGYIAYGQMQTVNNANAQIAQLNSDLKNAGTSGKDADTVTDGSSMNKTAQVQKDDASLAAGHYACVMVEFGCDKVVSSVTHFQEMKILGSTLQPGFAVVKATSQANGMGSTNIYLKTIDAYSWSVIYEGTTPPSQDVIKKFAIPAEFTK